MFALQDIESNISEVHSIEDETFDNIVMDILNFMEKLTLKIYLFVLVVIIGMHILVG